MKNEIKMIFIAPVQYSSEDHFEHKIRMERYKDCNRISNVIYENKKILKLVINVIIFYREIHKSTKNTIADLASSLFICLI